VIGGFQVNAPAERRSKRSTGYVLDSKPDLKLFICESETCYGALTGGTRKEMNKEIDPSQLRCSS
jgi:hypothetical protein